MRIWHVKLWIFISGWRSMLRWPDRCGLRQCLREACRRRCGLRRVCDPGPRCGVCLRRWPPCLKESACSCTCVCPMVHAGRCLWRAVAWDWGDCLWEPSSSFRRSTKLRTLCIYAFSILVRMEDGRPFIRKEREMPPCCQPHRAAPPRAGRRHWLWIVLRHSLRRCCGCWRGQMRRP